MNLRAILLWKILIGISLIVIAWWAWNPIYENYDNYNDETKNKTSDKGLGNKKAKQIKDLEQKLQGKKDNQFIIANNPTALSRVVRIKGLEDEFQTSNNIIKTLVVYGKTPNLKAKVLYNGIRYTVLEGDTIAGGIIKVIDDEKLIFVKDTIQHIHYYNKKRR